MIFAERPRLGRASLRFRLDRCAAYRHPAHMDESIPQEAPLCDDEHLEASLLAAIEQVEAGRYQVLTPEWIASRREALLRRLGPESDAS